MADKIAKGIELIEDLPGRGAEAEKGSSIVYSARFFLRKGDEVSGDAAIIERAEGRVSTRHIDGVEVIEHKTQLGRRRSIAAVEYALYGMRPDGYREVIASPHLCYGTAGIEGRIPANAMLRIKLWVHDVSGPADRKNSGG